MRVLRQTLKTGTFYLAGNRNFLFGSDRAVHILQPDLTWCGGLTEIRRVAAMAAGENLPVVPHRGGSLYGLNLILATPNCVLAESFGIGEPQTALQKALTPRFENGYYLAPEAAGFGTSLTSALLEKIA